MNERQPRDVDMVGFVVDGTLIREWLLWRGWAFIVNAPVPEAAPYYKPRQ